MPKRTLNSLQHPSREEEKHNILGTTPLSQALLHPVRCGLNRRYLPEVLGLPFRFTAANGCALITWEAWGAFSF